MLHAATFYATAGRVTALLGRNGQGTSTLFRVASGLLTPHGGIVQFLGTTRLRPRLSQLAKEGLFLLADRDLLSPSLTVRRQLEWVAQRFNSRVFRTMAAEGCAVVLTGHEVHTVLEVADHVTWCTYGTTYQLGTPAMARAHEQFYREYLGPLGLPIDHRKAE